MSDEGLLIGFHEELVREVRGDLSGVPAFERRRGFEPYFQKYYANFLSSDPHRVSRTLNGFVTRRRPVAEFVARLKETFGPHPDVLDIGCGFGSDSLFLARQGCRVVGLDPERAKVEVARHRLERWRDLLGDAPEPQFRQGYLEDAALDDASFHGIFTSECLHHCEPVENVLLEARRVIEDGGLFFVLESNAANPVVRRKRDGAVEGRRRTLYVEGGRVRLYGNENIRRPRDWRRLFEDCGFVVREEVFSRHLVTEALGSARWDAALTRLPGALRLSVHVSYLLAPAHL